MIQKTASAGHLQSTGAAPRAQDRTTIVGQIHAVDLEKEPVLTGDFAFPDHGTKDQSAPIIVVLVPHRRRIARQDGLLQFANSTSGVTSFLRVSPVPKKTTHQ